MVVVILRKNVQFQNGCRFKMHLIFFGINQDLSFIALDLIFVAPDLFFVAPDLIFVAPDLIFVALDLIFLAIWNFTSN